MALSEQDQRLDFIFGLAGNKALKPRAEPLLAQARVLHQEGIEAARRDGTLEPADRSNQNSGIFGWAT